MALFVPCVTPLGGGFAEVIGQVLSAGAGIEVGGRVELIRCGTLFYCVQKFVNHHVVDGALDDHKLSGFGTFFCLACELDHQGHNDCNYGHDDAHDDLVAGFFATFA
jgi:hypothetical protein